MGLLRDRCRSPTQQRRREFDTLELGSPPKGVANPSSGEPGGLPVSVRFMIDAATPLRVGDPADWRREPARLGFLVQKSLITRIVPCRS